MRTQLFLGLAAAFAAGFFVATARAGTSAAGKLAKASGHLEACADNCNALLETMEKADKDKKNRKRWRRIRKYVKSKEGKADMQSRIAAVYADNLSDAEIEALGEMFGSGPGAKWGRRLPKIEDDLNSAMAKLISDALVADVKKRGS